MCVLWNEKEERFVHVVSRENFAFIVDWLQNHWLHPDSDMVIMSADFGKYLSKLKKKNSPQCNIFKKSTQSFPDNSPWWIPTKWIDRTMDFQKSNLVGGNSPWGIYANWLFLANFCFDFLKILCRPTKSVCLNQAEPVAPSFQVWC